MFPALLLGTCTPRSSVTSGIASAAPAECYPTSPDRVLEASGTAPKHNMIITVILLFQDRAGGDLRAPCCDARAPLTGRAPQPDTPGRASPGPSASQSRLPASFVLLSRDGLRIGVLRYTAIAARRRVTRQVTSCSARVAARGRARPGGRRRACELGGGCARRCGPALVQAASARGRPEPPGEGSDRHLRRSHPGRVRRAAKAAGGSADLECGRAGHRRGPGHADRCLPAATRWPDSRRCACRSADHRSWPARVRRR